MLAFVVADVRYYDFFFCVEELVVFIVAGDENICSGTDGMGQEQAAGTAAEGYPLNVATLEGGMTYAFCFHLFFEEGEEIQFRHWAWQGADHAGADMLVDIGERDDFVCDLLIYMACE